jgi:hypothetical protein
MKYGSQPCGDEPLVLWADPVFNTEFKTAKAKLHKGGRYGAHDAIVEACTTCARHGRPPAGTARTLHGCTSALLCHAGP